MFTVSHCLNFAFVEATKGCVAIHTAIKYNS